MNKDLEHIAGGVLDDRDAAADLRDRLSCELASTPVLDVVNDLPRSTTRTEWFRLTRDLIQSVIADMDLDPDSLSQVEEAFVSAGLL